MRSIEIGNRWIGEGHPCFVIAEAGVNHNGDLDLAFKLVEAAADSGADAVKFQTFKAEELVSKSAPRAKYQVENVGRDESQFDMLKRLELPLDGYVELKKFTENKGLVFLSTPFDETSVDFLKTLNVHAFKIPSGEITNLPYLRKIGALMKPVILSTGMAVLDEIGQAINVLESVGTGKDRIIILHCTTEYPTPINEVNLRAMLSIKHALSVQVGYSDHTQGINVSLAAIALGACLIEKHFTLNKNLPGPDHKASLEPHELKQMVSSIRNIEKALGDGIKQPTSSEERNRLVVRKSIVAATTIKKGDIFDELNLTVKRPGTGISPMLWDRVIGKIADQDYQPDEFIKETVK